MARRFYPTVKKAFLSLLYGPISLAKTFKLHKNISYL